MITRPDVNRRHRPRFYVEGQAEVIDGVQRVAGEAQQISDYGARLAALEQMRPGTDFRLMLNVFDVSVAVTAQVKYLVDNLGMGVEFHQIRRGDRPLLDYGLNKLKITPCRRISPTNGNRPAACGGWHGLAIHCDILSVGRSAH